MLVIVTTPVEALTLMPGPACMLVGMPVRLAPLPTKFPTTLPDALTVPAPKVPKLMMLNPPPLMLPLMVPLNEATIPVKAAPLPTKYGAVMLPVVLIRDAVKLPEYVVNKLFTLALL